MTFLVDAQLPPLLARALIQAGHEAVHVDDIGFRGAVDRQIWQHALASNSIIITKDFDFADRAMKTDAAPVILWLRLGNCGNSHLIERVLSELPRIMRHLELHDRLIELE